MKIKQIEWKQLSENIYISINIFINNINTPFKIIIDETCKRYKYVLHSNISSDTYSYEILEEAKQGAEEILEYIIKLISIKE